jgi:hypothetical protein
MLISNPYDGRRNDAATARDITARTIQLRAETLDADTRSVEAAIVTETPALVFDWRGLEVIEEILRADGVELPAQVPLLANHSRWSLDDVLGSIRDLRNDSGQIVGRLFLAEGDDQADRAWNKIRQKHLTDVSAGYCVLDYVDIQPGKKATIAGREYTAGKRTLRVTTRWALKEGSLVPIGADPAAKIRKEEPAPNTRSQEKNTMNEALRTYLQSLGLRADSTEAEAWTFYGALGDEQRTSAGALLGDSKPPVDNPSATEQRSKPLAEANAPPDADAIRREAVAAERRRVEDIRRTAGEDVPGELTQRAIAEGWDGNRFRAAALESIRAGRSPAVPAGAPAGHVRRESDVTCRALAAAALIGQGSDPTKCVFWDGRGTPNLKQRFSEQDADLGYRLRSLSAPDLVRECVRLDSGRNCRTAEEAFEMVRASGTSGATLSYVFGTNVYARLIEGYESIGDTTLGFCDTEDVPNFLQQEDISLSASARLEQLPRGQTAKHATVSDTHETYKIARYAKQFVVDEQDVIDDRLGAIMRMPYEMGQAARRIRPDLVYSLINENPTLVADSIAVFYATHSNLGAVALTSTNLKTGISAMTKQRDSSSNVLNIVPQFLIVPAALEWNALELTTLAALGKIFADSTDPLYTTENLIARRNLTVVVDDRLGATGCIDPRTGSARTGSDTAWYLAAGGSRSIRVAYRRGTGRAPVMRSFQLAQGQWGMGWDINLDIGAAFMDYRPWYKSVP